MAARQKLWLPLLPTTTPGVAYILSTWGRDAFSESLRVRQRWVQIQAQPLPCYRGLDQLLHPPEPQVFSLVN